MQLAVPEEIITVYVHCGLILTLHSFLYNTVQCLAMSIKALIWGTILFLRRTPVLFQLNIVSSLLNKWIFTITPFVALLPCIHQNP